MSRLTEEESASCSEGEYPDFKSDDEVYSDAPQDSGDSQDSDAPVDPDESQDSNDLDQEQLALGTKRSSNVESRREQKIRRLERQSGKKLFPLLQSLKPIWEKLRQSSISRQERQPLVDQALQQAKGHIVELIFKHDASRIIQTLVKFSNDQQRIDICTELKGRFADLCRGRYSKHLISKMLKLCPSKRAEIVQEIGKESRRLLRSREASKILELVFMQYANATQKRIMSRPFYGPAFRLFTTDDKRFDQVMNECDATKRNKILASLLDSISAALDKGLAANCFLHHLMTQYLEFANDQERKDLLGLVREHLVEMLHTHLGYRIVCQCLAISSAKERKAIVKSFKPFLAKIAQDEFGHLVLILCLALVDDTVLLEKYLLSHLKETIAELIADGHGKKLVLFPFVGFDNKHYSNDFVKFAQDLVSTSTKLEFTKKPLDQKLNELKTALRDCIVPLFAKDCRSFVVDRSKGAIFMALNENQDLFLEPLMKRDPEHVLFTECGGFFYKKLVQLNEGFSLKVYERLKGEICELAQNPKSCFLILTLLNDAFTQAQVQTQLLSIKKELGAIAKNDKKIAVLYEQLIKK